MYSLIQTPQGIKWWTGDMICFLLHYKKRKIHNIFFGKINLKWCMHTQKYRKHHVPNCINIQDNIFFKVCFLILLHKSHMQIMASCYLTTDNQNFANTPAQSKWEMCLAFPNIKVSCASLLLYFPKPDKSMCAALQKLKGFFNIKLQEMENGISHLSRVSALADHSHATTSKPARRHSNDLQGAWSL